jgi:hypothetical protein
MIMQSPHAVAGCMTNATPSFPLGVVAEEAPSLVQPPNTGTIKIVGNPVC